MESTGAARAATVLVVGALGAIGRPLTELLVGKRYRVAGTTRSADRARELLMLGAIPVVVDAYDRAALTRWVCALRPDGVIHQLTDLPRNLDPSLLADALARNARIRKEGTANLVHACQAAGVRHLVAQSIAWAYAPSPDPVTESFPLDTSARGSRGTTVEGVVALERAVLESPGIEGCVLRYGRLYGPGTGSETKGDKEMALHAEAAAWAAVLAMERRATGVFNVAEPNPKVNTDKARRVLAWSDTMRVDREGERA
jgi:nucleoside-diphosphate-sugar epimerase